MIHNLFRKLLVEVRNDELAKGPRHAAVFVPATLGPILRQEFLLHHVGKQDGIGPIAEPDEIEETLLGSAVRIGEIFKRRRHRGVQQVFPVGVGGPRD